MHVYELIKVSRRYETSQKAVNALEQVSLSIADGELLAVQGPTGGGKSTLLQLLGGLDSPTSGQVLFDGRDIGSMGEGDLCELRARSIGFVFQTFNLVPTLTARENVEVALQPLKVSGDERRRRAGTALERVGLADRADHRPAELSGGQQQRVAIARALVKEPKVVLADEPTGNLDEEMRDEIISVLEALWREQGLTLVIVTHDSTVARRAQRIAWIKHGRLSIKGGDAQHAVTTNG